VNCEAYAVLEGSCFFPSWSSLQPLSPPCLLVLSVLVLCLVLSPFLSLFLSFSLSLSPLSWFSFYSFAVIISSEFSSYGCLALMERSRSPRRSSSSGSCQAPRVTLPVQHSELALSPTWHPTRGVGLAGVIPPPPPPISTWGLFGLQCKPNLEFYDYQKIKWTTFSSTDSVWSQSLNIAGHGPLTLPLSKVLQGGMENG